MSKQPELSNDVPTKVEDDKANTPQIECVYDKGIVDGKKATNTQHSSSFFDSFLSFFRVQISMTSPRVSKTFSTITAPRCPSPSF